MKEIEKTLSEFIEHLLTLSTQELRTKKTLSQLEISSLKEKIENLTMELIAHELTVKNIETILTRSNK